MTIMIMLVIFLAGESRILLICKIFDPCCTCITSGVATKCDPTANKYQDLNVFDDTMLVGCVINQSLLAYTVHVRVCTCVKYFDIK